LEDFILMNYKRLFQINGLPGALGKKSILFRTVFCIYILGCSAAAYSINNTHSTTDGIWDLSLQELGNIIVVSTTKTELRQWETPSTVITFSAQKIRKMGVRTLYQLLDTVAGVQTYDAGVGRQRAWFRGSQSEFNNKVAMFIDGVPVRDFRGGFAMDFAIPLDSVKKIEVIRGPGSALYGTNAFSGVINIFTYNPGEKAGGAAASIRSGNNSMKAVHLNHDYISENLNYILDINVVDTDGVDNVHDRNGYSLEGTGTPQQLNSLRIKFSLLEDKLILNAAWSKFLHDTYYKGENRPKKTKTIGADISAQYKEKFRNDINFNLLAFYTLNNFEDVESNNSFWQGSSQLSKLDIETAREDIDLMGVSTYVDWDIFENSNILFGVDYSVESISRNDNNFVSTEYDINGNITNGPTYSGAPWTGRIINASTFALYLQNHYKFNSKKTTITSGVRYDWLDNFDAEFSYRIALVHQINSAWFSKAMFGIAFRAPSLLEYTRVDEGASVAKPENMETTEIQLGYHGAMNYATLTGFHNQYNNYIERDNSDSVGGGGENFRNTGDRVMYGLEFESSTQITNRLNLFNNLAYLETEDKELDEALPFIASVTYSMGISYDILFDSGIMDTYFYFNGSGSRNDFNESITVQPTGGERPSSFSNGYVIINSGLAYHSERIMGLVVGFDIYNLQDKQYYDRILPGEGLRGVYADGEYNRWDTQSPGRSYLFSLEYNF